MEIYWAKESCAHPPSPHQLCAYLNATMPGRLNQTGLDGQDLLIHPRQWKAKSIIKISYKNLIYTTRSVREANKCGFQTKSDYLENCSRCLWLSTVSFGGKFSTACRNEVFHIYLATSLSHYGSLPSSFVSNLRIESQDPGSITTTAGRLKSDNEVFWHKVFLVLRANCFHSSINSRVVANCEPRQCLLDIAPGCVDVSRPDKWEKNKKKLCISKIYFSAVAVNTKQARW